MKDFNFIKLRENSAVKNEAALWFCAKWHVPLEAYEESIGQCLTGLTAVPQWYLVLCGEKIIAGAGVIENDFHDRKDLTPNLCALFVEPPYRNQGIARRLLQFIKNDMRDLYVKRLYLITDHTEFYEKCGWHYLTKANCDDGSISRIYTVETHE